LGAMGEGGMAITNNENLARKMKRIRDHGSDKKYYHSVIGFNFRLEAIQGAILGVKLKYLSQWIRARQKAAKIYDQLLKGLPLVLPFENKFNRDVYYVYVVRSREREKLQEFLKNEGVGTIIHYPIPIHLQEAFRFLGYKKGDFPETEKAAGEILSLPFWPEITLAEQKYVARKIKDFYFKNV
jgi:dTDP-4-amino-4,6-dideoxygalactose transaminase